MSVPADDRGLLLGDGLFETVLFRAGEPVLWDAHLARLERGCDALALPRPKRAVLEAEAARALADEGLNDSRAAVRLTWTGGSAGRGLNRPAAPVPRLLVAAAASERPSTDAVVVSASVRRNAASPSARLKSLSYLDNVLARMQATAAGADEALMLNTDGRLACAAAANLFWLQAGVLLTPAPQTGRMDGVMARQVIVAAAAQDLEVRQVRAGVEALEGAEAIFLTSSLIGIRPAGLVGRAPPAPSPVVERLASAVSRFV